MPSFVCDQCQETLKKAKLDIHVQRCRGASFSCIDCYKSFKGQDYRQHFSCITEVEKYEKKKVVPATPTAAKRETTEKEIQNTNSVAKKQKIESPIMQSICGIIKDKKGSMSLKEMKKALKSSGKHSKKEIKEFIESRIFLNLEGNEASLKFNL